MVEKDIKELISKGVGCYIRGIETDDYVSRVDYVIREMERIEKLIIEYGLENKLLADAIEKVYNAFIDMKLYSDAASFAKKYGL